MFRRTFQHVVSVLCILVVVVFCRCAVAQDKSIRKKIEIPSAAVLGKALGDSKAFDDKSSDAVYPENVQFDLDRNVVYGLIAVYPTDVKFGELVDAVNKTHRKWWKDTDEQMAKFGVTVWRNEEDRVAIQVSDSQIIMIWLDRRVTDREKKAVSKAFREIERTTDKVEKKPKKRDKSGN